MRRALRTTIRQRVTNYGDAQLVRAQERQTIFTMQKDQGSPLLVTVQCVEFSIPTADLGTADFRPMVRLSWGHGASSVDADFDCTYRQRIPVAASTAEVQAFIGVFPIPGGASPLPVVPDAAFARFRGFVSEGTDDLPMAPTRWVTQINQSTGVLAEGQARLVALRAWSPAATPAHVPYFLLFDQPTAPVGGEIPVDGMPLVVAGPVGAATGTSGPIPGLLGPESNTSSFTRGIAWGISSTPYVFTADPDALTAFVRAELLS